MPDWTAFATLILGIALGMGGGIAYERTRRDQEYKDAIREAKRHTSRPTGLGRR